MSRMRFAVLWALLVIGSLGVAGEPPSEFPVMPVGEAARLLGFRLEDMRPTVNQPPDSDIRTVTVRGQYYVVRSLRVDRNGRVVRDSLNDPQCPASVSTSVRTTSLQAKPRTHRPTRNTPRLTLLSATFSGSVVGVVFEVAAIDKEAGPLAFTTEDLSLIWASKSGAPHSSRMTFGKRRGVITLQPGEAKRLRGWVGLEQSVPLEARNGDVARVVLSGDKSPQFDYQWLGQAPSNTKPLRIVENNKKSPR